jgi:hypothetical protein
VAFGAGDIFKDYMSKYGGKYKPAFVVDNNPDKWGRECQGVIVRRPGDLRMVPPEDIWLIMTTKHVEEVAKQVGDYGICDYKVYSPGRKIFESSFNVID